MKASKLRPSPLEKYNNIFLDNLDQDDCRCASYFKNLQTNTMQFN